MFSTKRYHELELKMLEVYLKNTQDHGLVFYPNSYFFKVDTYPDYDFAGMYGHENHHDTTCANSRPGFIITFSDCLVLWIYKFQTETALSTMEADIFALAHFC